MREWMTALGQRMEEVLDCALPSHTLAPQRLHTAMRYAVLGGGKRVRPLLVHAAGAVVDAPVERLESVAAALELIHAYSLVHDDLPCMDNDVLRRGQPTVHVKFDEATALLVGDALQTLAFETLCVMSCPSDLHCTLIGMLASASGSRGMAGGQAIDLQSVGLVLSLPELEQMHCLKTGALLRASVLMGGMCGRTLSVEERQGLEVYADAIGLAFQVADDILDVEADTATLGKTAGKDASCAKPTYVSLLGLDASKQLAETLRSRAHDAVAQFGESALRLRQLADFVVLRSN